MGGSSSEEFPIDFGRIYMQLYRQLYRRLSKRRSIGNRSDPESQAGWQTDRQIVRRLWWMVSGVETGGGRERRMNQDRIS